MGISKSQVEQKIKRLIVSTTRYTNQQIIAILKRGLWYDIRRSLRFQSSVKICIDWIVLEVCQHPSFAESRLVFGPRMNVKVWSWVPVGNSVRADIDVWSSKDAHKAKMVKAVIGSSKSDQISVECSHWEKTRRKRAPRYTAKVVKKPSPGNLIYFEIRGRRKG